MIGSNARNAVSDTGKAVNTVLLLHSSLAAFAFGFARLSQRPSLGSARVPRLGGSGVEGRRGGVRRV